MSGFLERLAARSTGHARVLEPRRLLFEPREEPAFEAGLPAAETPAVERPEAEPAALPARRAAPAPGLRAPARSDDGASPPPSAREHRPVDAPAPAARAEAAPRAHGPPPPEPRAARAPRARRQDVAAREDDAGSARTSAPRPRAERERPVPRQAPLATGPAEPPAALARLGLAAASEAPAAPEVVRVTIGRVEVSAVQQPAEPSRRRPPRPPRLTLEEYLGRGRPR